MAGTLPPNTTVQYEPHPSEETIEAAAKLYVHLMKDDPTFVGAVSGRLDLGPQMSRAVIKPLALVSGELYTAKDEKTGELVGFAIWVAPGRTAFDTPEQLEMGFLEFLKELDDEGRAFQEEIIGKTMPKFIDETTGIEKAEQNAYWCWFAMIREDYQRKGLCRKIFDMAHERAKAIGATMALLTASTSNVTAYEKMGLKVRGQTAIVSPWCEWTFYSMSRDTTKE